jgi:glycosyltransferase involved in cell wall biosynthesis
MRILMLNYEYPPLGGGGGKQSMYLAKELAKKHDVYFLTAGWKEFGITRKDNYILHRIKTNRKRVLRCSNSEMISYVFKAWERIDKIVTKFKPDLVHIFFTIPTGLLAFHPKLKKIPFIVSVRGSDVPGHSPDRFKVLYKLFTPIAMKIWNKAGAVICNSKDLQREVLKISPSLKVGIIPNGIDSEKFKPAKSAKVAKAMKNTDAKKNNKALTLLYVGRIIPLKRIDLVIKQLPWLIKNTKKKVLFRIAGSGDHEPELRKLAKELKVEKNIEFVGEVSYEHIEKEYQKADIYAQLSKVEGMSNTIIEAMACGLPIITTNVGGASSFIKDNGFIIRKNLVEELRAALAAYAKNPALILEHGKKSREIAQKFSWKKVADSYEEAYDELA